MDPKQQMVSNLLSLVHNLGLEDCYVILPTVAVDDKALLSYWKTLEEYDTLKYRWADMFMPTAKKVLQHTRQSEKTKYYQTFVVMDCDNGSLVADLALENFTGRSAQAHFSMHPENDTKMSIQLGNLVTDAILDTWPDVKGLKGAFLDTLYGLTPLSNRTACIFVMKTGMKKMGVLPSGITNQGKVEDAMVSFKTRIN